MTFLAGLLIASMFSKQMIGDVVRSRVLLEVDRGSQGREMASPSPWAAARSVPGPISRGTTARSQSQRGSSETDGPGSYMEAPLFWSYRNSGRFYVECRNGTKPAHESWSYDQAQGRLSAAMCTTIISLAVSVRMGLPGPGPAGPALEGELRYGNDRWYTFRIPFLAFPGHVYTVDFALAHDLCHFSECGGTVVSADICEDLLTKHEWFVVGTEKSFHFLTGEGSPKVSMPRAHDCYGYLARWESWKNRRIFCLVSTESRGSFRGAPGVQDRAIPSARIRCRGARAAHRDHPQRPYPAASYAKAFFGLVTPMTEVATLVRLSHSLRSEGRSKRSTHQPVLLDYLENMRYFVPGTSRFEGTPGGLIPGYVALILLSAAASALGCFVLARRSAFSRRAGSAGRSWASSSAGSAWS